MMTDLALRMEIEDGTNATVQDLVQSITQEEQLRLPRIASTIFTLWMSSGLLGFIFIYILFIFEIILELFPFA